MKSKRAKEFIGDTFWVGHPAFPIRIDIKNDLVKAVELAEQDAEEKIEALKAIAVEAFKEYMKQEHGGFLSSDLDNFIQKLNEQ